MQILLLHLESDFYRLRRLLDPKEMGDLFKVMFAQKKGKKFNLGF